MRFRKKIIKVPVNKCGVVLLVLLTIRLHYYAARSWTAANPHQVCDAFVLRIALLASSLKVYLFRNCIGDGTAAARIPKG